MQSNLFGFDPDRVTIGGRTMRLEDSCDRELREATERLIGWAS